MRKWLILLLVGIILVAGCARASEGIEVTHEVVVEPSPPPPPPPPPPPEVRLVFAGDLMLARLPGEAIARGTDAFASLAAELKGDVTVGNLECVVATVGKAVPKAWNFRCNPRVVPLLANYFTAVSTANNHSGDYGKEAYAEMLDTLRKGGLAYFGGGYNLKEAHTPLIVERNGLRIALLGYDDVELQSYEAGPSTPGVAWLDGEQMAADVAAARAMADIVIVFPHWGLEYHKTPSDRQVALARRAIDAGADLVVGAHPHVIETAEYYKGKLIVYSLGNFVFDDFNDVAPGMREAARLSWVLRVTMSKDGLVSWDTVLARTDDDGIPRRVPAAQTPCGKTAATEISLCEGK